MGGTEGATQTHRLVILGSAAISQAYCNSTCQGLAFTPADTVASELARAASLMQVSKISFLQQFRLAPGSSQGQRASALPTEVAGEHGQHWHNIEVAASSAAEATDSHCSDFIPSLGHVAIHQVVVVEQPWHL